MIIPKIVDYPKSIHLRGETYKVIFVKKLKCIGETDADRQVIRIRAGMSRNETFRTFIHEIFHLLEFVWPINLSHKQVYKLEKAVFQLILDNFV